MIEVGNIKTKVWVENMRWIMGSFIDENNIFHSDVVEVKYSQHKKWEQYKGSTTSDFRKTLVILLSGCAEFSFGEEQFLLSKPMDYIIDTEIPGQHTIAFFEDTIFLVIRHY